MTTVETSDGYTIVLNKDMNKYRSKYIYTARNVCNNATLDDLNILAELIRGVPELTKRFAPYIPIANVETMDHPNFVFTFVFYTLYRRVCMSDNNYSLLDKDTIFNEPEIINDEIRVRLDEIIDGKLIKYAGNVHNSTAHINDITLIF
jgi:hypothetical protein